jgi:hypothetical protein
MIDAPSCDFRPLPTWKPRRAALETRAAWSAGENWTGLVGCFMGSFLAQSPSLFQNRFSHIFSKQANGWLYQRGAG